MYGFTGDIPMSTLKVDTIQGKTTSGTVDLPAGCVVQVTNLSSTPISGRLESSSTSYVASNLEGSITPKFSDSKINVRFASTINTNTDSNHMVVYTIYRKIGSGSYSNLRSTSGEYGIGHVQGTDRVQCPLIAEIVDTPNTTSTVTYKVYARSVHGITFELPSTQEEHLECVITEIRQ